MNIMNKKVLYSYELVESYDIHKILRRGSVRARILRVA